MLQVERLRGPVHRGDQSFERLELQERHKDGVRTQTPRMAPCHEQELVRVFDLLAEMFRAPRGAARPFRARRRVLSRDDARAVFVPPAPGGRGQAREEPRPPRRGVSVRLEVSVRKRGVGLRLCENRGTETRDPRPVRRLRLALGDAVGPAGVGEGARERVRGEEEGLVRSARVRPELKHRAALAAAPHARHGVPPARRVAARVAAKHLQAPASSAKARRRALARVRAARREARERRDAAGLDVRAAPLGFNRGGDQVAARHAACGEREVAGRVVARGREAMRAGEESTPVRERLHRSQGGVGDDRLALRGERGRDERGLAVARACARVARRHPIARADARTPRRPPRCRRRRSRPSKRRARARVSSPTPPDPPLRVTRRARGTRHRPRSVPPSGAAEPVEASPAASERLGVAENVDRSTRKGTFTKTH
jgi:hypothetical protein